MPAPNAELLDSKQCAGLLGVHEVTLVVWRRENRGPPWLAGSDARVVLYAKDDVLAWLKRHTPPRAAPLRSSAVTANERTQ